MITVRARRYECQRCGACMLVVPREILPRRLYTACAIGLALAMWALLGATEASVRARISPLQVVGFTASGGWITLRRWAADAADGRLFATSRASPKDFTLRKHAEPGRPQRVSCCLRRRRSSSPSVIPISDGGDSRQP